MYEAGDLDMLDLGALPPLERDRARQLHAEEYVTGPRLSTTYVGFVTSRPPFNDPRVRRAFVMATDRETLAHVVMRGYFSPAMGGFVPLGMPGHTSGIDLPYDPRQARQLLAEAGYLKPTGSGFPVVELLAMCNLKSAAEYLEIQWRETLGLKLKVEIMEQHTMLRNRLDTRPTHMFAWSWMAEYPDPDNFLRASPVRQDTRWRDQDYEELVEEARQVMDQGERMKLYQQADKILVEEAAIMPLYHGREHLLVKPWVKRYLVSPMGGTRWKDVILEPH
jgi:oligopeptide transport system substrate-binding protein